MLGIVLKQLNPINAGYSNYGVFLIITMILAISAFYGAQLPIQYLCKEVPITAGWLKYTAIYTFCFIFD